MDEQNITLRIGSRDYPLKVKTPEAEQVMRLAAEDINNMLAHYNANYPDKPDIDKLAFVCLGQAVGKINANRAAARLSKEMSDLDDEIGNYLAGIENR